MKQDIHQLESLLSEKNEFSALDWLISIDRLDQIEYQQWLSGEKDHLEECLQGSKKKIKEKLVTLEKAAKAFQLKSEKRNYTHNFESKEVDLSLSLDNAFAELLGRYYKRDNDAPQMDLFFDNSSLVQENLAAESLAAFDLEAAKEAIDQLYRDDATNKKLSRFEYLLDWATRLAAVESSDSWPELKPLFLEYYDRGESFASESLGVLNSAFVKNMWNTVCDIDGEWKAETAKSKSFYVSALFLAKRYAETVKQAQALGPEDLAFDAVLCLIRAAFYEEENGFAWTQFLSHLWEENLAVNEFIETLGVGMVEVHWENYNQLQDRIESSEDIEVEDQWFPFYILLKEPWLSQHVDANWNKAEDNACLLAMLTLTNHWMLLKAQDANISDEREIEFRKKLQDISPSLLEIYKR